jgi:hypothetical protein
MKVNAALETGGAVCVVLLGGGGMESPVGTSPAKTTTERRQVKAVAIRKRFIDVSPSKIEDARLLTSCENRATSKNCCKATGRAINIRRVVSKFSYTHFEGSISHEDNLTYTAHVASFG